MYHLNFSCNVTAGSAPETRRRVAGSADCNTGAIFIAAAFLCSVEASAMADSTASFQADAIGAAPKGWTATKTGKGDPKWTIEPTRRHLRIRRSSNNPVEPLTPAVEG